MEPKISQLPFLRMPYHALNKEIIYTQPSVSFYKLLHQAQNCPVTSGSRKIHVLPIFIFLLVFSTLKDALYLNFNPFLV